MSRIIIEGITEDGQIFHPRNWIDRLSASLATFGADHRLHYSRCAQPQIVSGKRCLVVAVELAKNDPEAFGFLIGFAKNNRLRVREDTNYPGKSVA